MNIRLRIIITTTLWLWSGNTMTMVHNDLLSIANLEWNGLWWSAFSCGQAHSVNALGSVVANRCSILSIYNSTSLANQLLIMLSLKRLAIHEPTTSSISVLGCSFEYMTIGLLQLVILAPSVDCTTPWSGAEDVLKRGCCNCRML